jgi:hypothetical protein
VKRQTPESFWGQVKKGYSDECWEWQGFRLRGGYGKVAYQGQSLLAHRVAAFLSGVIDSPVLVKGKGPRKHLSILLHSCDNKSCCNPRHLSVGSYIQNSKEAVERNRIPSRYGLKNPKAVLNSAEAAHIKELYKTNRYFKKEIAQMYRVSPLTIMRVIAGTHHSCKHS